MPSWKKLVQSGSSATLRSVFVTSGLTGSLQGTAQTASYVNTLNQYVLIGSASYLTIGTASLGSTENTLVLGPPPNGISAGEGGQIMLQAPLSGGFTSASMIDNYQNYTRLLRGSNNGSDAVVAQWNMQTKQMTLSAYTSLNAFPGTPVAALGINSSGDIITIQTGSGAGGGGGSTFQAGTNVDNRVITATGGSPELNGEANLTFNGSSLTVTGTVTSSGAIVSLANNQMYFRGGDDAEFWDINIPNAVGIYGQQTQGIAAVKLGSSGPTLYGSGSILIVTGSLTVAPGGINEFQVTSTGAKLGNLISDTHQITGSLNISGSITGNLTGTSSWATNAVTSSYALSVAAGGSNTQIQYNSASVFQGSSNFVYNYSNQAFLHGQGISANGLYSFARGALSQANALYSFVDGGGIAHPLATGSHIKGLNNVASGAYSHAEGQNTYAGGFYSHAEGSSTQAIGSYSHAEGASSIAFGFASHAEGNSTIASGAYQTVVGQYNTRGNTTDYFVVGGGTGDADANRSDLLKVNPGGITMRGPLNFSAGTALVNATASWATNASNISTLLTTLNTDHYVSFVLTTATTEVLKYNTGLKYNPSTNILTAGTFSGTATNAATASYTPNAITTASISSNILTFTKGNGTTFNLTVPTGSGGGGGGSTSPGGIDTQVQFNSASAFGGNNGFTYDYTNKTVTAEKLKVNAWVELKNPSTVDDNNTPYTATSVESIFLCNTINAPVNIDLSACQVDGRIVIVKDVGGNAGTNNITFSNTIDNGNFGQIDGNYQGITMLYSQANGFWCIIGQIK